MILMQSKVSEYISRHMYIYDQHHVKRYLTGCVNKKYTDQPVHPLSQIDFTSTIYDSW